MTTAAVARRDAYSGGAALRNVLLCCLQYLFCLTDACRSIALNPNGRVLVRLVLQEGLFIEADNHARQVVRTEVRKGVVDEHLCRGRGLVDVSNEVNRFLVRANVPELPSHSPPRPITPNWGGGRQPEEQADILRHMQ